MSRKSRMDLWEAWGNRHSSCNAKPTSFFCAGWVREPPFRSHKCLERHAGCRARSFTLYTVPWKWKGATTTAVKERS